MSIRSWSMASDSAETAPCCVNVDHLLVVEVVRRGHKDSMNCNVRIKYYGKRGGSE